MPVIHLVRHGQASAAGADYDVLSELGHRQAAVIGAELARRGLREPVVACGTLRRQRETAAGVMAEADIGGAEPAVDARWNEYDHLELLRRYPVPEAEALDGPRGVQAAVDRGLRAWMEDPDIPDTDGWKSFAAGAAAALDELAAGLGGGRDAVVVTSGGVLAAVAGALLGVPPAGIVALNRVAVNGAITTITAGRSGLSLLAYNDHAHFMGERRSLLTYR
ncbi:histidine phosphatase family protein [Streptomyces sp. A7024]|uniref:Histidine phosphatase family protein n=1 Tax=Streptomyces coryli TaxID=1128680 RepID=A0A6G4UDZ2_9ACTN|nr:histidine phosphatase family protein [Streptomyces coryli]NGN69896.1 histidine phosphatase family protein [Streptomyces coryli]